MQKFGSLSLALALLIASTIFAPTAKACCVNVYITYYDCALNIVGTSYHGCNPPSQTGQQSGAFKEVETDPVGIDCGDGSDNWYQWNGSTWVLLPGPPSPTC
jgi:hypothetical protein